MRKIGLNLGHIYARMFNELNCGIDDNPALDIILCTDKSETMVKYSVLNLIIFLF